MIYNSVSTAIIEEHHHHHQQQKKNLKTSTFSLYFDIMFTFTTLLTVLGLQSPVSIPKLFHDNFDSLFIMEFLIAFQNPIYRQDRLFGTRYF